MNSILTTARKELRSHFLSPVALLFLLAFLIVTLLMFFTGARFFARNIADVRPLFERLPVLLIFLVSALTMRAWSEEQKMGTLELLMTLPLKTRDLVLGKFLAGLMLVALALLMTAPLPITVSMLGDIDWGPVIGGYVGALLLGSTYLAIGLSVSSLTDNQIVALMVTAFVGSLFYAVGADGLTQFASNDTSEILRGIGTGSRFESIERGVLDLRDFIYYGSLTTFFLVLNVQFLEMKRTDMGTSAGRARAGVLVATGLLAMANVIAGNLWLAPITKARADLTASGEYSISDVTIDMLRNLDEPLRISGYFSEKTHPLLAPLVPRIRDFLKEYEIHGAGKVTLEFIDPSTDEALEDELSEHYSVRSVPFRVSSRNEEAVVNSYFHLLIRYGDQFTVLSFNDLIEVHADENDVDVRLRNVEYDVTKTIKKVTQDFQSIESMLSGLEGGATLTAYITTDALPEDFQEVPDRIRKIADELTGKGAGKFKFEVVDPSGDEALQRSLYEKYGLRPMLKDLFGQEVFYLHMLFRAGGKIEAIYPSAEMSESDIRKAVESAVKRAAPGFLKTVGIVSENPPPPPDFDNPFAPKPKPQGESDFKAMEQAFRADFTVRRVDPKDGAIPADIDVLIVSRPGDVDDKKLYAIDQYLMRGGALIVMTGAYDIKPDQFGIGTDSVDKDLLDLLAHYGITVGKSFVMDTRNASFPSPERRGQLMRIKMVPYPFFVDVRQDGFTPGHLALAGLQNVVLTWASPLLVGEEAQGRDAEVLIQSSGESWIREDKTVLPDYAKFPEKGFGPEGEQGQKVLAAAQVGRFGSYFADKPSPLADAAKDEGAAGEDKPDADLTGRTIKESPPDARLAVVGSSAFAGDLIASLGQQMGGGVFRGNFQFVRNLIDWSVQDTELLSIRSSGAFARTLVPLDNDKRTRYELTNYAVVIIELAFVVIIAVTRRRRTRPIALS